MPLTSKHQAGRCLTLLPLVASHALVLAPVPHLDILGIQCILKSQIYFVFGIRCIFKTKIYLVFSTFCIFGSQLYSVLGIRSKLTILPNTDLDPPDGEAPSAGAHSGAGHQDLTILQPVDIEHREAVHCAVEHSSAATVCHLLRWEDVN